MMSALEIINLGHSSMEVRRRVRNPNTIFLKNSKKDTFMSKEWRKMNVVELIFNL